MKSSTTVTMSWSASSGATYYKVGVVDISTDTMVVSTAPTTTNYTATLTAGKTYRWNVAADNTAGQSAYTTVVYFPTPPPLIPAMPTGTSPGTTSSPGPMTSSTTVTISSGESSGATYY